MRKFWNITQKNFVSLLIITGLVYLIGLILNLIFMYGILGGLHDMPVFPLASTMSLISVAMFWIISGPFTVTKYFTLAISMSTTRENYILTELFQTVLGSLILYILCFLLFQLENSVLIPLCYSGFSREPELPFFTALFGSFSSGIFWMLAFAAIVLGIRLFLGSLLIRFGLIIYWILWGIWMCASIFLSSMDSEEMASLEHHIDYAGSLLHGHFMPLLCCAIGIIISCIGICLLKKQDVRYI
ncbi:MAG: hypothetical protein K2J95_11735 [Lachnospiraceae bacterium]|nr:hypothetical protein [Lachnospiraceae bacterium]